MEQALKKIGGDPHSFRPFYRTRTIPASQPVHPDSTRALHPSLSPPPPPPYPKNKSLFSSAPELRAEGKQRFSFPAIELN